jgi:hypothetical protein
MFNYFKSILLKAFTWRRLFDMTSFMISDMTSGMSFDMTSDNLCLKSKIMKGNKSGSQLCLRAANINPIQLKTPFSNEGNEHSYKDTFTKRVRLHPHFSRFYFIHSKQIENVVNFIQPHLNNFSFNLKKSVGVKFL